jgi:4-carboxymuconolactone decarboxylase
VHDEIVAGRRGRFGGPFQILVRSPEVCRHLQRLGEYLRWGSSLPPALSELAICLTARHLRVNLEWHAHAPLAVEAGVPAAAIEAIRTGATPSFPTNDQVLVHRVVTELIDTKRLSDATFAEAISRNRATHCCGCGQIKRQTVCQSSLAAPPAGRLTAPHRCARASLNLPSPWSRKP